VQHIQLEIEHLQYEIQQVYDKHGRQQLQHHHVTLNVIPTILGIIVLVTKIVLPKRITVIPSLLPMDEQKPTQQKM
jgi:hypothetical protein